MAGKSADERDQHSHTGGGGKEILHRQPDHLREETHRCFTAIILPVGIGDKTDSCIERQVGGYRAKAERIERQQMLKPL